MTAARKPFVIALEEHYFDAEVASHFSPADAAGRPSVRQRLDDLGALRLKEMDEAGIDVQVISHGGPATQRMEADLAVPVARRANDRLHEAVRAHPDRFAGFACLPTAEPQAAADELERAVGKLGFKGAMVHGYTMAGGKRLYMDDRRFWPIFERAEALDVPIYLHPASPHPAVTEAYYQDYAKEHPRILTAGWGFTVETATQAVRLVLSGVFDAHPGLRIILGHLGESLPFSLWRIDNAFRRGARQPVPFRDIFREHFWITTSGNFSTPALLCSMMEIGIDRILFSVDWPYEDNIAGRQWMDTLPLGPADREKVLNGNARRLLRM